jgi:hypothetical protein
VALTSIIRRWGERLFGKWFEGPEMPTRLATVADDFARMVPNASSAEWVEVARSMARAAYHAGWQRGFEHAERREQHPWQVLPPERIADSTDPTWRNDDRGIRLDGTWAPLEDAERDMGDGD